MKFTTIDKALTQIIPIVLVWVLQIAGVNPEVLTPELAAKITAGFVAMAGVIWAVPNADPKPKTGQSSPY